MNTSLDHLISLVKHAGFSSVLGLLETSRNQLIGSISSAKTDVHSAIASAEEVKPENHGSTADESITLTISTHTTKTLSLLPRKIRRYQQAKTDKKMYQMRHGLNGDPLLPNRIETFLLLGVFVVIDAMINASFFLNSALAATPMAAALLALLISFANILLSGTAGFYFLRRLNYGLHAMDANEPEFVRERRKGQFGMAVYGLVLAIFLVGLGLVRSQETLDEIQWGLTEILTIFTSLESTLLVIVTGCLSAIALTKGRGGFDHPYIGFGAVQRQEDAALREIEETFDEVAEAIETASEDAIDQAKKLDKARAKTIKTYNERVNECSVSYARYQNALQNAESVMGQELGKALEAANIVGITPTDKEHKACHVLCEFTSQSDLTLPKSMAPGGSALSSAHLEFEKNKALRKLNEAMKRFLQEEKSS